MPANASAGRRRGRKLIRISRGNGANSAEGRSKYGILLLVVGGATIVSLGISRSGRATSTYIGLLHSAAVISNSLEEIAPDATAKTAAKRINRENPAVQRRAATMQAGFPVRLPEACQERLQRMQGKNKSLSDFRSQRQKDLPLPKLPPFIPDDRYGIPSQYLYEEGIPEREPMTLWRYDRDQKTAVELNESGVPGLTDWPIASHALLCIPDGIVADNGMAGPYRRDTDTKLTPTDSTRTMIHVQQDKAWFAGSSAIQTFVNQPPVVVDYPGLGVQLSANMGFTWNHFAGDTLLRLGLVYEALVNDNDPLWNNAKIIVSGDFPQDDHHDYQHDDLTLFRYSPILSYIFESLNITKDRLIPNNGWIVKAKRTTRFDMLVIPDVTPIPKCGGNARAPDPMFARGVLRPLQTAWGLTTDPQKPARKYIVYASRRNANRRRAVRDDRKQELLQGFSNLMVELGVPLKVVEWTLDPSNIEESLQVLRQAHVIVGPHGANLWNAAFSPPGGLLVEFNTMADLLLKPDCRTYGFSLAHAASLSYALVETPGFGYEAEDLLPDVEETVELVRAFLLSTASMPYVQPQVKTTE